MPLTKRIWCGIAGVAICVAVCLLATSRPQNRGSDEPPRDPKPAMETAMEAERQRVAERHRQAALQQRARSAKVWQALITRHIEARTPSRRYWAGLRAAFPFHIQAVAASGPSSDGSRTIIVAEPPPQVSLADIVRAVGASVQNHAVRSQEIGIDGWVKDAVIEVKARPAECRRIISRLNRLIYGSSYKAYALSLPPRPSRRVRHDLDLSVSVDDLRRWIVQEQEKFVPLLGGTSLTISQMSGVTDSVVSRSLQRGLILWWLPQDLPVETCRAQIRQFAMESDLIIGAIHAEKGVAVIGRERVIPLDLLPPLRYETVALLAAAEKGDQGQLCQSYERNHRFAGAMNGHSDWAPILLSPELRDTELGSLLNITDQLLKGWSENGKVRYVNFNYPAPVRYPLGTVALSDAIVADSVTFNWNTTGAGYTVSDGSYSYYGLNRTGALPVSYLPGASPQTPRPVNLALRVEAAPEAVTPQRRSLFSVAEAETKGYNGFAGLSDPNLVRVVQYSALYQIFSAFGVKSQAGGVVTRAVDPYPEKVLYQREIELLRRLSRADKRELDRLTDQLVEKALKEYRSPVLSEVLHEEPRLRREMARLSDAEERRRFRQQKLFPAYERRRIVLKIISEKMAQPTRRSLEALKSELEELTAMETSGGESAGSFWGSSPAEGGIDRARLNRAMNSLRRSQTELRGQTDGSSDVTSPGEEEERKDPWETFVSNRAQSKEDAEIASRVLAPFSDLKDIPDRYSRAIAARARGWIHTPVIVKSHADGLEIDVVGGHNLDAKVTHFRIDPKLKAAHTEIVQEGEIRWVEISPQDKSRLSAIVREVGRHGDESPAVLKGKLKQWLTSFPWKKPQPRKQVLGFSGGNRPPPDDGWSFTSISEDRGGIPSGWGPRRDSPLRARLLAGYRQAKDSHSNVVTVTRHEDGSIFLVYDESAAPIQAFTLEDGVDALTAVVRQRPSGREPVLLELHGFEPHEGQAFAASCDVRFATGKTPREISSLLYDKGITREALQALHAKRFNLAGATVRESPIRTVDGQLSKVISVEVREAGPAGVAATTEFDLRFHKQTPHQVVDAMAAKVVRAVKEALKSTSNLIRFNIGANRRIKALCKDSGIDVKMARQRLRTDLGDIYIARRWLIRRGNTV
jgi:hypothetical protein